MARLTQCWEAEHKQWQERDLSAKRYVYWWVDGIHFGVRLGGDNVCVLVIIGALGFWVALEETYGEAVAAQRCWVHKTANVLDKMPKSVQPRAISVTHGTPLMEAR